MSGLYVRRVNELMSSCAELAQKRRAADARELCTSILHYDADASSRPDDEKRGGGGEKERVSQLGAIPHFLARPQLISSIPASCYAYPSRRFSTSGAHRAHSDDARIPLS